MTIPTTRLFPSRRAQLIDWLRRSDPWHMLSLLIVLVVVLVGMWPKLPDAPSSEQQSTPAPVTLVATAVPAMSIPVVAPSAELRLLRAVVAYDAPEGTVLGAIEPGRPYELLARSGAAWVQLAIEGSGSVWVRRDELEGVMDVATPLPMRSRSSSPMSSGGRRHEHSQRRPRRRHQQEHPQLPRRRSRGRSYIGTPMDRFS